MASHQPGSDAGRKRPSGASGRLSSSLEHGASLEEVAPKEAPAALNPIQLLPATQLHLLSVSVDSSCSPLDRSADKQVDPDGWFPMLPKSKYSPKAVAPHTFGANHHQQPGADFEDGFFSMRPRSNFSKRSSTFNMGSPSPLVHAQALPQQQLPLCDHQLPQLPRQDKHPEHPPELKAPVEPPPGPQGVTLHMHPSLVHEGSSRASAGAENAVSSTPAVTVLHHQQKHLPRKTASAMLLPSRAGAAAAPAPTSQPVVQQCPFPYTTATTPLTAGTQQARAHSMPAPQKYRLQPEAVPSSTSRSASLPVGVPPAIGAVTNPAPTVPCDPLSLLAASLEAAAAHESAAYMMPHKHGAGRSGAVQGVGSQRAAESWSGTHRLVSSSLWPSAFQSSDGMSLTAPALAGAPVPPPPALGTHTSTAPDRPRASTHHQPAASTASAALHEPLLTSATHPAVPFPAASAGACSSAPTVLVLPSYGSHKSVPGSAGHLKESIHSSAGLDASAMLPTACPRAALTCPGAPAAPAAPGCLPLVGKAALYVRSLPQDADELFLYHVFGAYGALTFCKMINDPETNRPMGFVSFLEAQSALQALRQVHGTRSREGCPMRITLQASQDVCAAAAALMEPPPTSRPVCGSCTAGTCPFAVNPNNAVTCSPRFASSRGHARQDFNVPILSAPPAPHVSASIGGWPPGGAAVAGPPAFPLQASPTAACRQAYGGCDAARCFAAAPGKTTAPHQSSQPLHIPSQAPSRPVEFSHAPTGRAQVSMPLPHSFTFASHPVLPSVAETTTNITPTLQRFRPPQTGASAAHYAAWAQATSSAAVQAGQTGRTRSLDHPPLASGTTAGGHAWRAEGSL